MASSNISGCWMVYHIQVGIVVLLVYNKCINRPCIPSLHCKQLIWGNEVHVCHRIHPFLDSKNWNYEYGLIVTLGSRS